MSAIRPTRVFLGSRLLVLVAGVLGPLTLGRPVSSAGVIVGAGGGFGSLLAGSVDRFDAAYYLDIAAHGYGSFSSGKVAFFPLYPALIRLFTPVFVTPVVAGVVVSLGALLLALVLLYRLTELELGPRAARATVLLLAFAPVSFFFGAVYTESLFLMLSVGAVLAARRDRWALACALGALATLTRPTGVLLALLLAPASARARGRIEPRLAYVLVLPAALVAYLIALHLAGYPWLAPFRAEGLWGRATVGPVMGVLAGVWQGVKGTLHIARGAPIYAPSVTGAFSIWAENVILLLDLIAAGVVLVWCWRRMALEYALYALAVLLVFLSTPTIGEPLMSLERYALTAFPLWMAAGAFVSSRRLVLPAAVSLGALLLVFYTAQFSAGAFVA